MTTIQTDGVITNKKTKELIIQALTAKQRMFCLYYAISNNATLAARKAGYKDVYLLRKTLMKNALIIEMVLLLRKLMILDYLAQTLYCVMQYKKLIDMAMTRNDYVSASNIVLKLSKLKEPVNANAITGLVNIKIS